MQLVYTYFCNVSSEILQNKDKNAGFRRKIAKFREWERGSPVGKTKLARNGRGKPLPYRENEKFSPSSAVT